MFFYKMHAKKTWEKVRRNPWDIKISANIKTYNIYINIYECIYLGDIYINLRPIYIKGL